jgi:hypothetical protein
VTKESLLKLEARVYERRRQLVDYADSKKREVDGVDSKKRKAWRLRAEPKRKLESEQVKISARRGDPRSD